MARYRSRSRSRSRRKTRRNPGMRRTGTLIINGTRRRRKRKGTPRKRRSTRRSRSTSRRRNGRKRRKAPRTMTRRRNGRRRKRRKTKRRSSTRRRRRNGRRRRTGRLVIRRRNGRRRKRRSTKRRSSRSRRRNGSGGATFGFKLPFVDKLAKMVKKLPFIGKPLATALALSGASALGAVSIVPTTAIAGLVGRYVPNMPSWLFYGLVGAGFAGFVGSTKFLGASFHKNLAVAIAAATGGVAVYKLQTGDNGSMAEETGRLLVRSPMAGLGNLLGTLVVGRRQIAGPVAGYGPSAVRPMPNSGYGGAPYMAGVSF